MNEYIEKNGKYKNIWIKVRKYENEKVRNGESRKLGK